MTYKYFHIKFKKKKKGVGVGGKIYIINLLYEQKTDQVRIILYKGN